MAVLSRHIQGLIDVAEGVIGMLDLARIISGRIPAVRWRTATAPEGAARSRAALVWLVSAEA